MALGRNSVSRVGLNGNQQVDALLNDGWRFKDPSKDPVLSTALVFDTSTVLGRGPEIIDYVFDSSWAVPDLAVLAKQLPGFPPVALGQRQANQMNAINAAFTAWENVANIDFRQGPRWDAPNYASEAEIVMHHVASTSIDGFGGYSGTAGEARQTTHHGSILVAEHGRVHTYLATDGFMRGTSSNPEMILDPVTGIATPGGMMLIIHEIGHALGLKHPHDHGADGNPNLPDTNIFLPSNLDHMVNTIMSYDPVYTTLTDAIGSTAAVTSPMAFDIAAIQHLYGANRSFNSGNTTYVLTDASWRCIWDTGGIDEIVYNGAVDAVIDLNPATLDNSVTGGGVPSYLKSTTTSAPVGATNWATGGFMIAGDITNALANVNGVTGVIIENARGGSGNDSITGNGVDNKLYGNNGNDTLKGLGGNDWLEGGIGNDLLDGGVGADTMRGGLGADIYVVNEAGDVVTESGVGIDEVRSAISYTLGANVENLVLTGGPVWWSTLQATPLAAQLATAVSTEVMLWEGTFASSAVYHVLPGGLTHAIDFDLELELVPYIPNLNGTGNNLSNTIIGNAGNNIIDGRAGADRMSGGLGNDTYHVDSVGDVVTEANNAGADTVISTVSYTLGANVENLTLSGNGNINGFGNNLSNIIFGNARNNIIEGGGNMDFMSGGAGNDTFVFRSPSDTTAGWYADVILDFEDGRDNDTIDLSGFAGTLTFSTTGVFSGASNEVIAMQSGNSVLIKINTTGTLAPEAEILLANTLLSQIDAKDFLL